MLKLSWGLASPACIRIFCLALSWLAILPVSSGWCVDNNYKIFVVHSYDNSYIWCKHINEGISESLKQLNVEYKYFYMDAKNNPTTQNLRATAAEAFKLIQEYKPNIIIAADDPVQEYLVSPYLNKTKYNVIFCGVNANPSIYGFPSENVSGVRERWHYREAFKLLKQIVPEAKTAAFIVEDSESGRFVLDDMLEDFKDSGPFALTLIGVKKVRTLQEFKAEVLKYNKKADALALGLYQSLFDAETGKMASPAETTAWIHSVVTKPTIGFADVAAEQGMLCGILESAHEQGYLAGAMAQEVLAQKIKPGALPMRRNKNGVVLVNLRTAERIGVNIPFEIIEAAGVVVK